MSHAGHETVKCSCGAVIQQCRCFVPGKAVRVIQNGCASCQSKIFKAVPTEVPIGEYEARTESDRKPPIWTGYTQSMADSAKRERVRYNFHYLQPADRPVIDGLEAHEIVMAADQPQYNPLRCLAGTTHQGARLSRWTLTPEQRQAIAEGADIFLELWTFKRPMNPIRLAVSDGANPEYFKALYQLAGEDVKS